MKDDDIRALWASLRPQQGDPDPVVFARAVLALAAEDADVLVEYAGKDGRRDWVNVGVWLRPGEVIVHCDDPRPRKASGETTGYGERTP